MSRGAPRSFATKQVAFPLVTARVEAQRKHPVYRRSVLGSHNLFAQRTRAQDRNLGRYERQVFVAAVKGAEVRQVKSQPRITRGGILRNMKTGFQECRNTGTNLPCGVSTAIPRSIYSRTHMTYCMAIVPRIEAIAGK